LAGPFLFGFLMFGDDPDHGFGFTGEMKFLSTRCASFIEFRTFLKRGEFYSVSWPNQQNVQDLFGFSKENWSRPDINYDKCFVRPRPSGYGEIAVSSHMGGSTINAFLPGC